MSSSAVAAMPTPETTRTCLYERVVSIKIPHSARLVKLKHVEGGISYRQFTRSVKGGVVNFHAHGPLREKSGDEVTARARIFEKVLPDGRSYLYVDLLPTAVETPTHRLKVASITEDLPEETEHRRVFSSKTLGGGIVMQAL